jgi:hypothetical protein
MQVIGYRPIIDRRPIRRPEIPRFARIMGIDKRFAVLFMG